MTADDAPRWTIDVCDVCDNVLDGSCTCCCEAPRFHEVVVVPVAALDDLRAENEQAAANLTYWRNRCDEARAERDRLRADLALIAGTDPIDAVLDPDRALRVARAALAVPAPPTTPEKNDA